MSLTYILSGALISLVIIYYFILKHKKLLRSFLKYKENHLFSQIDIYGNGNQLKDSNNNDKDLQLKDISRIPGPKALPLLGTKWIYMTRYSLPKVHEAYAELYKEYGDIVLEIGNGNPFVHLFGKHDIEKVMRFSNKYPFRPPTEISKTYRLSRPDRYASCGIVNEQGELWHNLRSNLCGGLMSPKILSNFIPALNEIFDDFIELIRIKRDANGEIRNFQVLVNFLGLEAMAMLLLDHRLGLLDPNPSQEILNLAKSVDEVFVSMRDSFYGTGLWKYFPTKTWKDFVRDEENIYNVISDLVDKSFASSNSHPLDDETSVYKSILSSNLDIKDKKAGIIDILTAGIETISISLSFLMYHLSDNPECQDLIYKEFESGSEKLTYEEVLNATYTKACIKESYRMTPTAFVLARLIEEDTELSGYHIKQGSFVLCHTMIACQQEENFKDAEKFIPERWVPSSDFNQQLPSPKLSPNLVLPFGSGRRMCPGKRLSEMELSLLISKIVKNFRFECLEEKDIVCNFVLKPKDIHVRFRDRN